MVLGFWEFRDADATADPRGAPEAMTKDSNRFAVQILGFRV